MLNRETDRPCRCSKQFTEVNKIVYIFIYFIGIRAGAQRVDVLWRSDDDAEAFCTVKQQQLQQKNCLSTDDEW